MVKLILVRLAFLFPAAIIVVSLTFALFHLASGDPAILLAGERATQEVIDAVRRAYGFDQPLHIQFLRYLGRLLRGDLGTSLYNRVPVIDLIIPRFLNTAKLSAIALTVAATLSLGLGSISATRHRSALDRSVTALSLLGICVPVFVLGLSAMYVFSVRLRLLPISGMGDWRSYILPVLSISTYETAFLTRMTRTCMIDALGGDYVRTARAKGIRETRVVLKHALRNALLPVVTIFGLRLGYALGGAVVTETIFSWPGLGRLLVSSILQRDLPVTQGALLLFAAVFIIINLMTDVLYVLIDPRIEYD